MARFRFAVGVFLSSALVGGAGAAAAQSFPQKPIRIVAPYVPGGTVDAVARMLAARFAAEFNQQVVVENRAGASGNIGSAAVAEAPPDGYTLLLNSSTLVTNPFVMKEKPPFDPLKDFTPLALVASTPLVFVAGRNSGIDSVADFVRQAKAHPEKTNFGLGGYGSAGQMAMESFNLRTGLSVPLVIYQGSAPALTDIVGGQLTGMMDPVLTTQPFVASGRLKAIGVTGAKRTASLPGVPTLAEAGVPDINFVSWYGLWGPRGLPPAVAQRIQAAVGKALALPESRQWLLKQGMDAGTLTGDAFKAYVENETAKYLQVIKEARIEAR
ncbi:tripartite tricarboxylate transporter substrate binding protein [Pigmentiphaga soli]|uniref:Tripartite tricarboxylate transporter substrate binding protein n=1 Tax=Pigmentiphaga soli TaxID=1007095 RepID=A0ABP8GCG4_9BURK